MAFDAKQAVIDKLTHLDDALKQAKDKQSADALANADAVAAIESEIDGWQWLLSGYESAHQNEAAAKPAAKKATAKK